MNNMTCLLRRFQFLAQSLQRNYCSSSSLLVRVQKTEKEGVVILFMNNPPVNGLNLETVKSITNEVQRYNKDDRCRGIILASNVPKAYSAGVQLTEFYKPKMERLKAFWSAMQDMWIEIYSSRLPIVAAINNHAIAGGCLLAVACDRRIMSKGTIGLNETKVGLPPPYWLCNRFNDLVGKNIGDYALQHGLLFTPNEALKIGLVDKVSDDEDLIKTAKAELDKYLLLPFAFAQTKLATRKDVIQDFKANYDQNLNDFMSMIDNTEVQNALEAYYSALKSKKKG